jgi:hypothetical protein
MAARSLLAAIGGREASLASGRGWLCFSRCPRMSFEGIRGGEI